VQEREGKDEMKAKFIKAVKTRENPKKENASWTIINLLIPDVVKASDSETAGSLIQVMSKNDPATFELVKNCVFGQDIEVEVTPVWRGNRMVVDYKISSVNLIQK
jgi:hypothetical protein